MKIRILSKKCLEQLSLSPFAAKTAIVSIADYQCKFASLHYLPNYLHTVSFDDVDNDIMMDELGRTPTKEERKYIERKYHMISDEQATQIAAFYLSICDEIDCFICQCEHGQSRSAAVAAAILEYRSKKGIRIFANDQYYPNKVVFRKVLTALQSLKNSNLKNNQ